MAAGDHVWVQRLVYTHHGVEVENNEVVHFTGTPNMSTKFGAIIRKDSMEDFLDGGEVEIRTYGKRRSAEEAVSDAMASIGLNGPRLVAVALEAEAEAEEFEDLAELARTVDDDAGSEDLQESVGTDSRHYNLLRNNCEHFARMCVTGQNVSEQVRLAASTGAIVTTGAAAAAGGVGIIAAGGSVVGLSGAGIMTGLAGAGAAVGSGAVGGLVVLGAGPGIMSAAVMNVALRDDDALPDDEREARKAGRRASVAGVAGGMGAGVAAVSASGSVAGLSAAGITSGLAAIGATAGGGMAAGSAAVIAAPAIAAAGVGYGSYRLLRAIGRRRAAPIEHQPALTTGEPPQ